MRLSKVSYNTVGQKQCTKCQVFKDTSDFHKWSKGQDGLKLCCKACVKKYDDGEHDPKRIRPMKYNENGQVHCMRCKLYLDEDKFPDRVGGRYKTKIYKSRSYCIDCDKYMGHLAVYRKYGMTPEDYLRIEAEQNGVCKICENDNNGKRLMVDHDHSCCPGQSTCGKCVRGLLCKHCNWGLGNAKDSIELLEKMINYLKSY
jgi:hypothetical protein